MKIHKQDLVSVLNKFTSNTNPRDPGRLKEKSECAALLLKYFPPARDSVLEYYSQTISAILKSQSTSNPKSASGSTLKIMERDTEMKIFETIDEVLESNREFWSAIVCNWCLKLLTDVFANSQIVTTNRLSLTVQRTANKRLSCPLTKALMDILIKCISNLVQFRDIAYLRSILAKCIQKSPHFDWILAHIGSRFPNLILNEIIMTALDDFTIHRDIIKGMKSDKFVSAVGILGYLSIYHADTVNKVVLEVFNWSLKTSEYKSNVEPKKIATVPFLLLLFSFNMNLCTSLMKHFPKSVSLRNLRTIINYSSHWIKYFGSFKMFKCWLLQVVTNCKFGSIDIVKFLFDCCSCNDSTNFSNDEVFQIQKFSWLLLENILLILQKDHCNMLHSLCNHKDELITMLFDPSPLKYETAARLLLILGSFQPSIVIETANFLLRKAHDQTRLRLFVQFVAHSERCWGSTNAVFSDSNDLFAEILKIALKHSEVNYSLMFWNNLLILLEYEYDNKLSQFGERRVEKAILQNMLTILKIFTNSVDNDSICAEVIFQLFYRLKISQSSHLCLTKLLHFSDSMIAYFFAALCKNNNQIEIQKIITIFRRIGTNSREANEYIIRELIYKVIFTSALHLFGYKPKKSSRGDNFEKFLSKKHLDNNSSLIEECFRSYFQSIKLSEFDKRINRHYVIKVLTVCSKITNGKAANKKPILFTRMVQNALILVELFSPDVMYNGLPWPDEEFTKITMERDLTIYRMFAKYPIIWDIMSLVSINRPAACYCSVLFRGVIAILIRTWTSIGHQKTLNIQNSKIRDLVDITIKILDLMNTGELIPRPLVYLRDIIVHLKPIEISYLLRDCIWNYMKDNVPSPLLYSYNWNTIQWRDINAIMPKPMYTETVTNCIQNNIETLGSYYSYMFLFFN